MLRDRHTICTWVLDTHLSKYLLRCMASSTGQEVDGSENSLSGYGCDGPINNDDILGPDKSPLV